MTTLSESRVRGLMLGLAAGEIIGAHPDALPTGVLRHGVVAQLACHTADAGIRTSISWLLREGTDPPQLLFEAYERWCRRRSTPVARPRPLPGWLGGVPLLGEDRGASPATWQAITAGGGRLGAPVTTGQDWHALGRALPLAVFNARTDGLAAVLGAESAALTHGPEAWFPTGVATLIAAYAVMTGEAGRAVGAGMSSAIVHGIDEATAGLLDDAVRTAAKDPGQPDRLREGVRDDSCAAALWGATYCLLSFPSAAGVARALRCASQAPFPVGVAAVTGAFFGATYGADALPRRLVTRIDLAYVIDQLGRDLAREGSLDPDGRWGYGADPHWVARYPIR